MPNEIYNAIIEGLQKLIALRLRGAPSEAGIVAVAAVWEEALCHAEVWRGEDLPRVRKAFAQLYADCHDWPSPKAFLDRLPPRPPPRQLPRPPVDPAKCAAFAKTLKQLTNMLIMEQNHVRPQPGRDDRQTQ